MATKKPAAEKKEKPAKEKKEKAKLTAIVGGDGKLEGLDEFQETEVTGRTEPAPGKKKRTASFSITKVKLQKKQGLEIGFSRIETDGNTTTSPKEIHDAPVHPDMKLKFKDLRVHLGLLCGYISTKQLKDIENYNQEQVDTFHVSGFSVGGNKDDEGIVITGHKITDSGKAVILNSPFARFEEVAESRYKYMDKLQAVVDDLLAEVKLYLSGEKRGEEEQPELDFPDAEDETDYSDIAH